MILLETGWLWWVEVVGQEQGLKHHSSAEIGRPKKHIVHVTVSPMYFLLSKILTLQLVSPFPKLTYEDLTSLFRFWSLVQRISKGASHQTTNASLHKDSDMLSTTEVRRYFAESSSAVTDPRCRSYWNGAEIQSLRWWLYWDTWSWIRYVLLSQHHFTFPQSWLDCQLGSTERSKVPPAYESLSVCRISCIYLNYQERAQELCFVEDPPSLMGTMLSSAEYFCL